MPQVFAFLKCPFENIIRSRHITRAIVSFSARVYRTQRARRAVFARVDVIVAEELRTVLVLAGSHDELRTFLLVDLVENAYVPWLRGSTCGRRPGCCPFAWHLSLTRGRPSCRSVRHMRFATSFIRGISSSFRRSGPRSDGLRWWRNTIVVEVACSSSHWSLQRAF